MYGAISVERRMCGTLWTSPMFMPLASSSRSASSGMSSADLLRLHQEVEHQARRVALGEARERHRLVAAAGLVVGALPQVPLLVLERVHELVRERGLRLRALEVGGEVHRAVLRLVEALELRLEQLHHLAEVVERRRREAHDLEEQPLAAERLGRILAERLVLHAGDELVALELHARHGLRRRRCRASRSRARACARPASSPSRRASLRARRRRARDDAPVRRRHRPRSSPSRAAAVRGGALEHAASVSGDERRGCDAPSLRFLVAQRWRSRSRLRRR